jgi:hypothetical protein
MGVMYRIRDKQITGTEGRRCQDCLNSRSQFQANALGETNTSQACELENQVRKGCVDGAEIILMFLLGRMVLPIMSSNNTQVDPYTSMQGFS